MYARSALISLEVVQKIGAKLLEGANVKVPQEKKRNLYFSKRWLQRFKERCVFAAQAEKMVLRRAKQLRESCQYCKSTVKPHLLHLTIA